MKLKLMELEEDIEVGGVDGHWRVRQWCEDVSDFCIDLQRNAVLFAQRFVKALS